MVIHYVGIELLIETYFWVFFIIAPITWYLLRPMADAILKLIAIGCLILGIAGGLMFLATLI